MTRHRRSTLETIEEQFYTDLTEADSPESEGIALVGLGFTHARMGLGKLRLSVGEVVRGVRKLSPPEALSYLALYGGTLLNSGPDPLAREHATVLRQRGS